MCSKLSIQCCKNWSILVMVMVPSTRTTKHFLTSATMNQFLASVLSGISLWPPMGKALAVVLEVLSNALLVMQVNQYPIKDVWVVQKKYQCHWIYFCLSWWSRESYCGLWRRRKVPYLNDSASNKTFLLV